MEDRNLVVYLLFHQKKKKNGKITGNVKSLNYKLSSISSGGLEIPLRLTFSCPMEWVRNKMKDFIDDFYSYDFTSILDNDGSSDDSDIEIDLESVDVVEDNHDEDKPGKMKPISSVVCKEITNTLIQQEAACIVTNDD